MFNGSPVRQIVHSLRAGVLVAAASVLSARCVAAQAPVSGSVGVSARVAGSLSVTTQDELAFGTFTAPYAARRVTFTDNGPLGRRGRFTIRGDGDTELMMEVVVPDAMRGGVGSMPLSDWGMRVNTVDADVGGTDASLVTGVNRSSIRLPGVAGTAGMLYIRLSATAQPGGTQVPGVYGATVQVNLSFVGA
jgi:spore coat protein U-like protein